MMSEINLEKLGLHVIKRAIKDAVLDDTKIKNEIRRKKITKIKREAIDFLTKPNKDLEYWCLVANINYLNTIKETKKVTTDPDYWKVILKKLEKYET